jgi:hypothetical protein
VTYLSLQYLKRVWLLLAFIMLPLPLALLAAFHCQSKDWLYWVGYLLQAPSVIAALMASCQTPKIICDTTLSTLFLKVFRIPPPNMAVVKATFVVSSEIRADNDEGRRYIERRLEILEAKTTELADQMGKLSDRHESLRSVVENAERHRIAEHQQILSKLEAALLDGLPIAAVSICWLIVGISMSAYGGSSSAPVCGK